MCVHQWDDPTEREAGGGWLHEKEGDAEHQWTLVVLEWGRHIWLEGKGRGQQVYLCLFQGKQGNEGVHMWQLLFSQWNMRRVHQLRVRSRKGCRSFKDKKGMKKLLYKIWMLVYQKNTVVPPSSSEYSLEVCDRELKVKIWLWGPLGFSIATLNYLSASME